MAYKGTIQTEVIRLIAEKQVATSAIQGKFSAEGLSAMAQGVDVKVRLAQAMAREDTVSGGGLQAMFDVLSQDTTDAQAYANYTPMKLFAELISLEFENAKDVEVPFFDYESIFTAMTEAFLLAGVERKVKTRKEKHLEACGQLSLF